jgi:oligosaccharide repeat unit polymerase
LLVAVLALLIVALLLLAGRDDLTRPAVAFGIPWFGVVALAQLRLTRAESPWSTEFALVVFGGGLAFMAAATLAGGIHAARGRVTRGGPIRRKRLVAAALVLLAGGVAGWIYKASVLDGIPLFADDPDAVRGRALGAIDLPAWSSALTGGFYLGMWCALAALPGARVELSRSRRLGLWLLAAAGLFGVCLEASRNQAVFAVGVPLIGAYLLSTRRGTRSQLAWLATAVCVLAVGIGGLFLIRISRSDGAANAYIEQEMDRQPTVLKPLVPVYVNAVFPLEAARRLETVVPTRRAYGLGADSLTSLPNRAFPEGKSTYGGDVGDLMAYDPPIGLRWTVASYQGRLLGDLGWRGVLLGSLLLGLAFGSLYRWARGRPGLVSVAIIAYATYNVAYFVYDNHFSFSIIAVYDIAVLALVAALVYERPQAATVPDD